MSIQSLESPGGPPPRTNGTPSGYRNIRVLTPNALHFRLVAYAGLSMCSLNEFVLKTLHLATPIDPATGLPVSAAILATAPGQRPGLDVIEGRSAAPGLGASPSPGTLSGFRLSPPLAPPFSGSVATVGPIDSQPGQDRDGTEFGGSVLA